MKHKILLLSMLACSLAWNSARAGESEPNNDRASANTLALNGSNTGAISPTFDEDWWQVTTTADGRLRITLTAQAYTYALLFDNDGITQLGSSILSDSYTPAVLNYDGLAPGTYYIKLVPYSNYMGSYTIADSLFTPSESNDAEPNGTRALAKTLPLNGSKTGHIDYYYNNNRDTLDWYKVTTNADGRLRISLTPANGQYTYVTLYDNNGTTVLNSSYSNAAFNYSTDGLAAGTYYLRVYTFYNTGFAPYTLSDSLFSPTQANDAEPDSTKAQALVLPLNGSKTGHIDYYYNNHRDTVDWYKVTTNADGLLRISLTPANGQYTYVTLYDNNGTTVLNSNYNNTAFNYSTDGLAAGTYYLRVYTFYNNGWAPYTLSDSLFTYANANDAEPNKFPYQAATIPANGTVTGHTGFYYNNQRDSVDWWKINYTGSGALTITMNLEPTKLSGVQYTYMQIYKDTLTSPVYSQYTNASSLVANLTSLKSGYYWVRVITYYNTQFESYSLTPTFTQVGPKLTASYDTVALACSSNNKITIKATKSGSTTVQLYRYGVAYGSPVVTTRTATFKNLPIGSYYATGVADGASGGIMGTSKTVNLIPMPTNPNTTAIGSAQATLNWTTVSCARYYSVQYRVHGTLPWSLKKTTGNVGSYVLTGLTNATMYDWEVAAVDTLNGIKATSIYTDSVVFTTAATPFATAAGNSSLSNKQNNGNGNGGSDLQVFPNPASSKFRLQFTGINTNGNMVATLKDINGRTVWQAANINSAVLKSGMDVDISKLPNGVYYLQLTDANKNEITQKVIVQR